MLTNELAILFGKNDRSLTKMENELIEKINVAYEKAVRAAIDEFKELEKINGGKEADREEVKKILDKTIKAFSEEYEKLVMPIQDATNKSYVDGLKETKDVLTILNREGETGAR